MVIHNGNRARLTMNYHCEYFLIMLSVRPITSCHFGLVICFFGSCIYDAKVDALQELL